MTYCEATVQVNASPLPCRTSLPVRVLVPEWPSAVVQCVPRWGQPLLLLSHAIASWTPAFAAARAASASWLCRAGTRLLAVTTIIDETPTMISAATSNT